MDGDIKEYWDDVLKYLDTEEGHMLIDIMLDKCNNKKIERPYYLDYGGVGNWNHGMACICDYQAKYCKHCGVKLDWHGL